MSSLESPALVVVHAQHPLVNVCEPGAAFASRLTEGARLYQERAASLQLTDLFVPGSRHRVGAVHDEWSLADAGSEYLHQRGIPRHRIHGEDWIRSYAASGIYHSGDEVRAAAEGYWQNGYNKLYAVCSVSQVGRLALHYGAYNLEPDFHSVEGEDGTHDSLAERILSSYTKHLNQSWNKGLIPNYIRRTRLPTDGKGIYSIA